jgi:catechol 2,3-dioxygenase-like lactoylglutathione lyase family enzyme
VVSDLDAARAFYCGVLGLGEAPRPELSVQGAWLEAGPQQIHIIVSDAGIAETVGHVAFEVDDVHACADEVEAAGIAVRRSPDRPGVRRQVQFRDPFGNLVELNQPD